MREEGEIIRFSRFFFLSPSFSVSPEDRILCLLLSSFALSVSVCLLVEHFIYRGNQVLEKVNILTRECPCAPCSLPCWLCLSVTMDV